jgi:hypothetical protein
VAGELVVEGQAVFANSALINTPINIAIPSGGVLSDDEETDFEVIVRNPSLVTALNVALKSLEKTDSAFGGGADRYPTFQTIVVPVNTPEGTETVVHGWGLGAAGGRITVSNATALGVADGFSADVRVRKL